MQYSVHAIKHNSHFFRDFCTKTLDDTGSLDAVYFSMINIYQSYDLGLAMSGATSTFFVC